MANVIRNMIWETVGRAGNMINRVSFPLQKNNGNILRFDTSVDTDNMGDFIIMHYCNQVLYELFPDNVFDDISTHSLPTMKQEQTAQSTKYKFVCGTNLLTSHIEEHWRWQLPDGIRRKFHYRNVILLGVGWGEYQDECSVYSRMVYRCMLNPNVLHSVRDQYTLEKLHQAGIRNVINTGCPTTWHLTPEFCQDIPTGKAEDVVTTITDYRRDPEWDNQMLQILSRNYKHVYLWLQGRHDEEYLSTLQVPENLSTIPDSLEDYESVLEKGGVDYVGTRLHAGIHALNYHIRSIIIAVDNRATEMGRDINLPVLPREQIGRELEAYISSPFPMEIRIKQRDIERFKEQFRR